MVRAVHLLVSVMLAHAVSPVAGGGVGIVGVDRDAAQDGDGVVGDLSV